MRLSLALLLAVLANPALAHIGHLADVGGHGHWIALGGIAIAAGIAWLGARKKDDADPEDTAQIDDEDEGEPA